MSRVIPMRGAQGALSEQGPAEPREDLQLGLERVLARAARDVLAAGGRELAVPPHLARLEGVGPSGPLAMTTRRFRGGGFRALTIAAITDVSNQLRTATVVGLPEEGTLFPILGVDLIALRGGLSLLALDLAPTDPAFWEAHAEPILCDVARALEGALVPRSVPRFAESTFSRRALIGAAQRGRESSALSAALLLVEATGALTRRESQRGGDEAARRAEADAQVVRWCAAELQNRREHDALARIFGAETAREYLEEYLFAEAKRRSTSSTESRT